MKKFFGIIVLMAIVSATAPQVQAQTRQQQQELEQIARRSVNGLSPQDRQRVVQIMTDVYVAQGMSRQQAATYAEMAAGSMFSDSVAEATPEQQRQFTEQQQQINEFDQRQRQAQQQVQPVQTPAQNPANLVTPAGKAWVIRDNDVQGSGKALIMKSDKTYEFYLRKYGIWVFSYFGASRDTKFNIYSATGSMLEFSYANDAGGSNSNNHNYTISGNTMTITGNGSESSSGKWTLMDFSGSEKHGGGSIVLQAGMGWFNNERQMIFNTNGIYAAYGYPSPWASILHEGTYTLNSSTDKITINENVPPQPGRDTEYSYSITEFPGGNKTLRIWGQNRNGYQDDVYKLQAYPSGTKLPRMR